MAYQIIHLQNLTELKSRVGGTTSPTLATILGLNYPEVEAFSVYVWDNNSNEVPDDNNIVRPTPRAALPGRWYKVELDVAPHSHAMSQITGLVQALATKLESESDPTVGAHIKAITASDISLWNSPDDYSEITNKPETFPPNPHTHAIDSIPQLRDTLNTKAPSVHSHMTTDITGLSTALEGKQPTIPENRLSNWDTAFGWGNHAGLYKPVSYSPVWNEVGNKPTTFPAAPHTHPVSDITGFPNIPTNTNQLTNGAGFITGAELTAGLSGKQNTLTLTTTGTGAATLVNSTLNIPNSYPGHATSTATIGQTRAQLNAAYPNTPVGFRVFCPDITLGGSIYTRVTTGSTGRWQGVSAPPVL